MSRIRFSRWRVLSVLVAALAVACCLAPGSLTAIGADDSSTSESALRARVEQLYSALQANDWTKVETFLTDDSKETYRQQAKSGVKGFEIKSVKLDPDGQKATVIVEIPVWGPGAPGPIAVEKTSQWVIVSGVWYVQLPKSDPNLLKEMFQAPPRTAFGGKPLTLSQDLKFQSTWVGAGYFRPGEISVARFPFTNVGKHPVSLVEVQTGSDCLQLKTRQKEFKPGESAVLEFAFDPSCLGTISIPTGLTQTVLLKTEPGDAWVKLTIAGRLMPAGSDAAKPSN